MKRFPMACLTAALALLLAYCTAGEQERESLVVATYTYATNNRIDNLKPFSENVGKVLGVPVETKSYPDVASFIRGIEAGEVDVALINTFGYLLLALDNDLMTPVAALNVRDDAKDNYKTVLLVRADAGVADLAVLSAAADSLTMTFVNEGSTSGNLVPRLLLSAIGVKNPETQFAEVRYGGNHTSTFEQLLAGETDVAAIGSDSYFQEISKDSTLLDSIRVLWMSDEIPLGPVLIKNSLSQEQQAKFTELVLNLHQTNPAALESIKAGWSEARQSERFMPVTDSSYDNFRRFQGNEADLAEILSQF